MGGIANPLETKNDDPKPDPALLETKNALSDFMKAFDEYKVTNDGLIAEIKKDRTDPLAKDKLAKIDTFLDKYEGVSQKLTLAGKTESAVKELEKKFDEIETIINRINERKPDDTPESKSIRFNDWARAVVKATRYTEAGLDDGERKMLTDVVDEYKALNLGTSTEGGYLAPTEMIREIIKTVTEISPVRTLARVRQTGMRSVEIPKRIGQFAAQWVAEQGTKEETRGLEYGIWEIPTHEFYALIDITNQLLEDSMFNMSEEIQTETAEQFALAEGTAFVLGSGVGQPEGFMVNPDVSETVSGTAAGIADVNGQANGMIDLKYSIKSFYMAKAMWLMRRTTIGAVRKLKDGENNYIWMPGIAQGRPNMIDGDPYMEVPDMPAIGADTYPIAYGDFRRAYTWVDRLQMDMLRDPYTQATGGKIRYIMRKRVGGKVVLPEAIAKLKCDA